MAKPDITLREFLDAHPDAPYRVERPHLFLLICVPLGWLLLVAVFAVIVLKQAHEGTGAALLLVLELLLEGAWTIVMTIVIGTWLLGIEARKFLRGRPAWALSHDAILLVDGHGRSLQIPLSELDYVAYSNRRALPMRRKPYDRPERDIVQEVLRDRQGVAFGEALRLQLDREGWEFTGGRLQRRVPGALAYEG